MSRDSASLVDIYEAGQQILAYAQGIPASELKADQMRMSAILYQILVMGEATKRLSQEFRAQHPDIPWSNIAGMRDIVAHHYDRVDFDILWNVVHHSIPDVIRKIEGLLPQ